MKSDENRKADIADLPKVSKEIYTTFFSECACPMTLALIEEIYKPFISGYFNLRHHLLEPVLRELERKHITPVQAILFYLRVYESHNFNLLECVENGTPNDTSQDVHQILENAYIADVKNFHAKFENLSLKYEQIEAVHPFCQVELKHVVIERPKS